MWSSCPPTSPSASCCPTSARACSAQSESARARAAGVWGAAHGLLQSRLQSCLQRCRRSSWSWSSASRLTAASLLHYPTHRCGRDVLHHCLEHTGVNVTEALEADPEAYRDESECWGRPLRASSFGCSGSWAGLVCTCVPEGQPGRSSCRPLPADRHPPRPPCACSRAAGHAAPGQRQPHLHGRHAHRARAPAGRAAPGGRAGAVGRRGLSGGWHVAQGPRRVAPTPTPHPTSCAQNTQAGRRDTPRSNPDPACSSPAWQAHHFGLHLCKLDIRQESVKHTEALDAVTTYLGLGSYK